MRCRRARSAIVNWGLGLLPAREAAELRLHLEHCAACQAESVAESRMVSELAALRRTLPAGLEVGRRVAVAVGELGPVARDEVSPRQLGWAAAATVAAGLVLALVLIAALPSAPALARELRALGGLAAGTWGRLEPALLALGLLPLRFIGTVAARLAAAATALQQFAPLARSLTLAACAWMILTIGAVVARDLVRGKPASLGKEQP